MLMEMQEVGAMWRRCWGLVMVLALLGGALPHDVRAQDGPELPPVLRNEDVFAADVEVVERLPLLHHDAEMIYYFDPARMAWTAHAFPESFERAPDIVWQPGEQAVVNHPSEWEWTGVTQTWYFDPPHGVFIPAEVVCGAHLRATAGAGSWEWWADPETGQFYLCNTASGELAPPLPDDISVGYDYRLAGMKRFPWIVTSPDGEWVVFRGEGFDIVAYQPLTGQLNRLGTVDLTYGGYYGVPRWADDAHPVITVTDTPEWWPVYLGIADVTQPDSLRFVGSQIRYRPQFFDDPPRYEWVPAEFGEGNYPTAGLTDEQLSYCGVHVFDLTQQELIVLPYIPTICSMGFLIPNGGGDRIVRDLGLMETRGKTADLVRYNPYTGVKEVLFTGEIEWLSGVSWDGHYAFFVLGNSGGIAYPYHDPWTTAAQAAFLESPEMVVFDLTTLEIAETFPIIDRPSAPAFPPPQLGEDDLRALINADIRARYDVELTLRDDGLWRVEIVCVYDNGWKVIVGAWIVRVP